MATTHCRRSNFRPKGQRARITCVHCQKRKVRCDAELSLLPCTNCGLDGIECMLFKGKREPRSRLNIVRRVINKTLHAKPGPSPLTTSLQAQLHAFGEISTGLKTQSCNESDGECQMLPQNAAPPERAISDPFLLPPYVRPLPNHLDSADYYYLRQKGVLTFPSEALQKALIKSFLESVHSILPVIDIHQFLQSRLLMKYPQISLFLYHAVMYSGIATVPIELLTEEGFSSRADARDRFYVKVEALAKISYVADPIELTQGGLLMAYWQDLMQSSIHRSSWMQFTLLNLQSIDPGLRGSFYKTSSDDRATRSTMIYKRLYWGFFVVDRLHCLATHQPPYLCKLLGRKIEGLKVSDFEISPYPDKILGSLNICPKQADVIRQTCLAKLFILSVCLFERLETLIFEIYPPLHSISHGELRPGQSILEEARECAAGLLNWYENFTNLTILSEPSKLVDLFKSFLSIIFDTSLGILLDTGFEDDLCAFHSPSQLGDIQRKRLLTTTSVTSSFLHLKSNGLLEAVPPCIAVLLVSTASTHYTQPGGSWNPYLRGRHAAGLSQCLDILGSLSRMYPSMVECVNQLQQLRADACRSTKHKDDDKIFSPRRVKTPGSIPSESLRHQDDTRPERSNAGEASSLSHTLGDGAPMADELGDTEDGAWVEDSEGYAKWGVSTDWPAAGAAVHPLGGGNIAISGSECMEYSAAIDSSNPCGHVPPSHEPDDIGAPMANWDQFIESANGTREPCIAPSLVCSSAYAY